MTPESQRHMVAQIAANARWAKATDRKKETQPARDALLKRFEDEVDPRGELNADERRRRAVSARKAHMQRLALRSAQKRAA